MTVPRPAYPHDMSGAALVAAAAAAEARREARLAAGETDLGRPHAHRIDEETRARAAAMIDAVVREVAERLRSAEPMLDGGHREAVAERFVTAGFVARTGLGIAALARAEEHRFVAALARAIDGEHEGPGALHLEPIGGVHAAEAHALREAEAVRIDRAGDPMLPLHDIAAENRHALFWHVAACLADDALDALGPARVGGEDALHRAAAAAVARTLATIDDGDGIAPAALRLAHAVDEAGGIDDALLAGTLAAGRSASLAGLLAVRARIGYEEAAARLTDPPRAAVLLRAAGVSRPVAAAMVLALALACHRDGDGDAGSAAADLMEAFDALPEERARADVRRARLEPAYRDALAALGARA